MSLFGLRRRPRPERGPSQNQHFQHFQHLMPRCTKTTTSYSGIGPGHQIMGGGTWCRLHWPRPPPTAEQRHIPKATTSYSGFGPGHQIMGGGTWSRPPSSCCSCAFLISLFLLGAVRSRRRLSACCELSHARLVRLGHSGRTLGGRRACVTPALYVHTYICKYVYARIYRLL